MAEGAASDVRQVPGQLVVNPTNLAAAFPHGGTAIGWARDHAFKPNIKYKEQTTEAFGNEVTQYFYMGERAVFGAMLWSWDSDALNLLWPDAEVQVDGTIVLRRRQSGGVRAGTTLSGRAVKLLFSPDAIDHESLVLFYRAIPLVEESAALSLIMGKDLGVPMLWVAIQDASGNVYEMGPRERLTV